MICNLDEKFHNKAGYYVLKLNDMVNIANYVKTILYLSLKESKKLFIL
jgi:ATP-dependent Clp protease adapter protein ClpS